MPKTIERRDRPIAVIIIYWVFIASEVLMKVIIVTAIRIIVPVNLIIFLSTGKFQ